MGGFRYVDMLLKEFEVNKGLLQFDFRGGTFSDTSLELVSIKFPQLRELILDYIQVTTQGLTSLLKLKKLQGFNLNHCGISDHALDTFSKLPKLQMLQLRNTKISLKSVQTFARKHPKCLVAYGNGIDDVFLNEDHFDEVAYDKELES
ncbi:MAG: hypothetical protein R3C03_00840 [Pirellulaceae bacterium]